jgi:hypothetical protein
LKIKMNISLGIRALKTVLNARFTVS